ncbi:MAG TPA: hypothetical protein VGJ13_08590 [Pseudonocardiaceae bacterium]|jgi:hypothetical protein
MSVEVVALGGGILFLLVAIVGGGFAIREIALPKVPKWARVASGVFGILLLLPFMLTTLQEGVAGYATPPAGNDLDHQPPGRASSGIEIDTEPATTDDQIRLMGLAASVRNDPPRVGDTITVNYSLTNIGNQPIQMEYTFVGARNPADENRDSEDTNEGKVLEPGATIQTEGRIFLSGAGTWKLWPCYALPGGRFCPDEWKAFNFIVK